MAEAKAFNMIPHCTKDTIKYEMDELVLCKDCKHYRINTVYPGTNMIMTYCAKIGLAENNRDWFCADGERRVR